MLPLLNLQLTTPAVADEMPGNGREMPVEGGVGPFAGFASLLKLRIADAAADGEVLPPPGSALPLSAAIELPAEVAADSWIDVRLPQAARPELPIESIPADVVTLAAEIDYPPTDNFLPVQVTVPAEPVAAEVMPEASRSATVPEVTLPFAAPGTNVTAPLVSDIDGQPLTDAGAPARPVAGQAERPIAGLEPVASARLEPMIATSRGREQGGVPNAAAGSDPLVLTQKALAQSQHVGAERALPPMADLPVRQEPSTVQRDAVVAQAVAELARSDRIVQQPAQTLKAGTNGHQAPGFAHAPSAPATITDPGYASIARDVLDTINMPVRDANWGDRLGERVVMMAGSQLKSAEIRLTPAELGPLRVQVAIDDGAANVTFHAQHALTRDAIEQALPRLRDMLAENGLALGEAHVGGEGVAEGHREQHDEAGRQGAATPGIAGSAVDDQVDASFVRVRGAGLVDTFA